MWAEPMVKLPCSRRGNHMMYIVSVTPYILGADGVKNSLVGACEFFAINIFSPIMAGIYIMVSIGEQLLFNVT